MQNHPQIRAAQYAAQAAGEVVREARSAYFPTVFGSVTGAEAEDGSRITAGGLNNPIILDRFAAGVSVAQLITDFGRTPRSGRQCQRSARDAQQQDGRRPAGRRAAAGRSRLLQRASRAGGAARRAGHGRRAPARRRPGDGARGEQPEVRPRRQLRQGEPGGGAAAARAGAQRRAGGVRRARRGARAARRAGLRPDRRAAARRSRRPTAPALVAQALRDRPDVAASGWSASRRRSSPTRSARSGFRRSRRSAPQA